MKQGTQTDTGEGALVDSDRLVTREQATEIAAEVREAYNRASAEAAEIGRKLDAASAAKHRGADDEPTWRLLLVAASVWMLGYVCIIGASALGWALLIAALAGNRWALAGVVYAVTLSIACGLLVSAISNGSSDS